MGVGTQWDWHGRHGAWHRRERLSMALSMASAHRAGSATSRSVGEGTGGVTRLLSKRQRLLLFGVAIPAAAVASSGPLARCLQAQGLPETASTYQHPWGLRFGIPAGWQVQPEFQNLLLLPPDAEEEEAYGMSGGLLSEPSFIADPSPLLKKIQDDLPRVFQGFRQVAPPEPLTFGAGRGVVVTMEGVVPPGQLYRVRATVLVSPQLLVVFFASGPPNRVAAREQTVQALLSSLTYAEPAGAPDAALDGRWSSEGSQSFTSPTTFPNPAATGASASTTTAAFTPDGEFAFAHESVVAAFGAESRSRTRWNGRYVAMAGQGGAPDMLYLLLRDVEPGVLQFAHAPYAVEQVGRSRQLHVRLDDRTYAMAQPG